MRMRITSLGEEQLATCIANSLWGSKRKFLDDWKIGDILLLCVNKEIAAAAEISGTQICSADPIWDNGLFPYRMPLTFTHYFKPNNRLPLQGEIRDSFYRSYGEKYGYVFLNKMIIKPETADFIMSRIKTNNNDLASLKQA